MVKKINKKGLKIIKKYEGCVLTTYRCPAGIPTIGYGHTGKVDGVLLDVKKPIKISRKKAESLLKKDLRAFEKIVNYVDNKYQYKFTNNEFSALVSFAYNLGGGCVHSVCGYGKRNKKQIAKAILLYDKANGKKLKGLTKRRQAEYKLFITK